MIDSKEFRKQAHEIVDWMADYLENIEQYPVRAQVNHREIYNSLPSQPPQHAEDMQTIMSDFKKKIIPGITHWQHPNFHAYFPANSSYASILAEMITATLGAQCMMWETSPAAAELEELVMNWLREMLGLPKEFSGVIQDTASTATLCAILSAREKFSSYMVNIEGLKENNLRIYCSSQTHSSIDKAVKIAGIGVDNLIKIPVDNSLAMDSQKLKRQIEADIKSGKKPLCVIATLGTTSTTAIDPIKEIAEVCSEFNIWLHVDAAYCGNSLILPEMRGIIKGIEKVDSFVVNPHKWMFTNFDCSAYFVKDKGVLIRTFEILPEYLKTKNEGKVNNYRDWGIALGRRFRALKLWFVIRNYGVEGIQCRLREHLSYAKDLAAKMNKYEGFEILYPGKFNLICFRYVPDKNAALKKINLFNEKLLETINASGEAYLTHTKIAGMYIIRVVIGQTYVSQKHVDKLWSLIKKKVMEIN